MGESHESHALDLSIHPSVHPSVHPPIANPSLPTKSVTPSLGSFCDATTKVSEIKKETGTGSLFDHNTFKQCNLRCTTPPARSPSLFYKKTTYKGVSYWFAALKMIFSQVSKLFRNDAVTAACLAFPCRAIYVRVGGVCPLSAPQLRHIRDSRKRKGR